jgi:hypothetical protein
MDTNNKRGAFTIPGFCLAYNVSRARVYGEIKARRLRVMKSGARTLVSYDAAADYEKLCESELEPRDEATRK